MYDFYAAQNTVVLIYTDARKASVIYQLADIVLVNDRVSSKE